MPPATPLIRKEVRLSPELWAQVAEAMQRLGLDFNAYAARALKRELASREAYSLTRKEK